MPLDTHSSPALSPQMKALARRRYGGPEVVQWETRPSPEPGPEELLIRVHASAVTTADWRLRAAAFPGLLGPVGRAMFGVFRPRDPWLGLSFAGEVVAVGREVSGVGLGARVFGTGARAHAEFMTVKADGAVALMPDGMRFAEAASLPFGGLSALCFLRDIAALKPDENVLICGGSGGVGTMAIQIAKALGARVTAMASAANLPRLEALGADRAIDYRTTPAGQISDQFDVILDPVSAIGPREARARLTRAGRLIPLEISTPELIAAMLWPLAGKKRVRLAISAERAEDLRELARLWSAGALRTEIDSTHRFKDAQAAHRRVESRHAKGTVVLAGWD